MIARVAEKQDFNKIHELVYSIFEKHLRERPDIYKEGDPYKLEQFSETLRDESQVILLAIEENKVIGLCHMVKEEFRGHEIRQDGIIAFIEDFIINKDFRRKGFGKELYKKSLEQAKLWNADIVELNVWEFNKEARLFYESLGLKVRTERMEYKL